MIAEAQVSGSWLGGSGSWSVASNWSSDPLIPGGGGTATFDSNSAATITLDISPLLSGINFDRPYTKSVVAGTGTITLQDGATIFAADDVRFNPTSTLVPRYSLSRLAATGAVIKTGSGEVTLSGTHSFSAGIVLQAGVLSLSSGGGIGTGSFTFSGGALQLTSGNLQSKLHIDSGTGTILMPYSASVSPTAGLLGQIDGPGSLVFRGASPGPANPWNAPTVSLGRTNTYAGSTTVYDATFDVGPGGQILNSKQFNIYGGTLRFSQFFGPVNSIPDDATVLLHNAFLFDGAGSESFGMLQINGPCRGSGTFFASGGIVRQPRATFQLQNDAVTLGVAPPLAGSGPAGSTSVGIIPWADRYTFPNVSPVTFQSGALRQLSSSEYRTTLPIGNSGENLLVGNVEVTQPVSINSLTVSGGTLSGSATLTVTSGAVFMNSAIACPIDFGSAEGILHAGTADPPRLMSGTISGTGGLLVDGDIEFRGTSTYTGETRVLRAAMIDDDVFPGVPGPFGPDSSAVVLENSFVRFNGAQIASIVFARDLIIQSPSAAPVQIAAINSANAQITGAIQLDGPLKLTGPGLLVSGPIHGTRHLIVGSVTLSGNNDFSGGVETAGPLVIGSDTALGTGTLWINNAGTVSAINGARQLANPVVFTSNALVTGGTDPLAFTGPVYLNGLDTTITVTGATTRFTGAITDGNLNKTGAGVLEINPLSIPSLTIGEQKMQIDSGAGASKTSSLAIAPSATLDLTGGAMVVDYTSASPVSQIQSWLISGYANGAWTGSGITSSQAAAVGADPANPHKSALGFAETSAINLTSFGGQTLDPTSLLIRYTLAGDANLDGSVNSLDFSSLAAAFGESGSSWVRGDFNYDGIVNALDFNAIATNFGNNTAAPSLATLVPEPLGVSLLGVMLLTRRRRRAHGPY